MNALSLDDVGTSTNYGENVYWCAATVHGPIFTF